VFLSSVPPPSVENVPAMANAIPGLREKCSASRRNRRSPSARKAVRSQPGIVFGFIPEWRSACPGFPTWLARNAKTPKGQPLKTRLRELIRS